MTTSSTGGELGKRLVLDDRLRLLMLAILNLLLAILVLVTISRVSVHHGKKIESLRASDVHLCLLLLGSVILVASVNCLWDWRNQVRGLSKLVAAYLFNRNNDGFVSSARDQIRKQVSPVGKRDEYCLRGLLFVMSAALASLVFETGGWITSPYTQFGFTAFLLSMLLTDIFIGRVSLALLGLCWTVTIFTLAGKYQTSVSSKTLGTLTIINFAVQLLAVALASETFEPIGFVKRRREARMADRLGDSDAGL
jgi:hypothetical protein